MNSTFVLTTCQIGAEPALKSELAQKHPELRFAYSRPGFVTFKRADGQALSPDLELKAIFARSYALSIGKADPKSAPTEPERVSKTLGVARECAPGKAFRLHVYERDRHAPGEEPLGFVAGALAEAAEKAIRAAAGGLFAPEARAEVGDLVFSVGVIEEDEWWFGFHQHTTQHSPFPGGVVKIELPPESPSRAYLKLEEGVRFSGAPLKAGDVAVEIGSAPGGATYALLQRGLQVVGIDPGEMDPRVMKHPQFTHIRKPVAQVPREHLPARVDWLLLDMNVAPSLTLFQVDRLATRLKDSLLGVLLTIKLNEWKFAAEIPGMLEHIEAMGMTRIRARQLYYNRQEIFVAGFTRKGAMRWRA